MINDPKRREKLECEKSKFKWICCDAVLVSGNVGGCKRSKHGFDVADSNQQYQRQHGSTKIDQLDQATIQQWEDACRVNEEYNDKWLRLIMTRR